jgi:hypothetical protein
MAQLCYSPVVYQRFWELPMVIKHKDISKCQISINFKETSVKAIYGPLQQLVGGYWTMPSGIK